MKVRLPSVEMISLATLFASSLSERCTFRMNVARLPDLRRPQRYLRTRSDRDERNQLHGRVPSGNDCRALG
jgi:hypothetical protein